MEPNKQLSICIPTYNRAKVLETLLIDLIPKVAPFQVSIYISDNNSPDETEMVVTEAQKKYSNIIYHRNIENIGADRNFEQVLKMSKSEYSWLLGDDDRIINDGIQLIFNIIEKNHYDIIVTNGCNKDGAQLKKKNMNSKEYINHNIFIAELWYTMTWMSTLIYSKELILNSNFEKYYNTNFLQSAVIFDYLASKEQFLSYWNSEPLVIYPEEDEIINHYTDKILFLFLQCWIEVVLMLPEKYNQNSKQKCIESSPISFNSLAGLRMNGYFNFHEFKLYLAYYKHVIKTPIVFIGLLSITPKIVLKIAYIIKHKLKNYYD